MSGNYRNKRRCRVLIELRSSRISGIGVFAISKILRRHKVADGLGDEDFKALIPWGELNKFDNVTRRKIRDFCIGTPEGFVPPDNLDFNKLSIEWYFNHSCDGNVGFNQDGDFIALRNIKRGQELTYDYGLAESNPRFKMRCSCGTKECRRVITGDDWKKEKFRRTRIEYMLPQLRNRNSPKSATSRDRAST